MACNSIAPVQGYGNPYQTRLNASADLPGTSANQDAIRQHATDHNIPEDQLGQALTALQGALARRPPDANEIKRIVAELANLFETNGAGPGTAGAAGTAGAGGPGGPSANDAAAPEQTVEEALRALGIPPDVIDRIVAARQNMASQTSPHVASLQSSPASTTGNAAPGVSNGGHGGGNGGGSVGNAGNVSNAGGNGGHGGIAALTQHVNGILADGRDHGFQNGIDSYVPRIQEAMRHLQQAGIVTAKDPYEAMQQTGKWLMANAGTDGVFSFGGGPANEDDAAALSAKSGISRGDINAAKFMFDDFHDAELSQKDSFLTVDRNNPVFQDLAGVLSSAGLFEHR